MNYPRIQLLQVTVAAGQKQFFDRPGVSLRFKEADFSFNLSLDDGTFFPFDVGMCIDCKDGVGFSKIGIENTGPTDASYTILVGGNVSVGDSRLNIVESRNGSAASMTTPAIAETVSNADDAPLNTWRALLPYDENRAETWLWTDAAAAAYWGIVGGAEAINDARNLAVTPGSKQWLRVPSKAAIYIRHTEAGKKVIAITHSF